MGVIRHAAALAAGLVFTGCAPAERGEIAGGEGRWQRELSVARVDAPDNPDCPRVQRPATVVCPVEIAKIEETSVWRAGADAIVIDGPKDQPGKFPISLVCRFCRECRITVGDALDGSEYCLADGFDYLDGCHNPPFTTVNDGCTTFSLSIPKPTDEVWEKAKAEDYAFFRGYCNEYLDKNPKRVEEMTGLCIEENLNEGAGATYTDHNGVCCDRSAPPVKGGGIEPVDQSEASAEGVQ